MLKEVKRLVTVNFLANSCTCVCVLRCVNIVQIHLPKELFGSEVTVEGHLEKVLPVIGESV